MIFNVKQFLAEYNIKNSEHGLNSHKGWIQINCPFCGDRLFHGGFNVNTGTYSCWRCKRHKITDVVSLLLKCSVGKAKKICRPFYNLAFKGQNKHFTSTFTPNIYPTIGQKVNLPTGVLSLEQKHKDYLIGRGFDYNKLVQDWDLVGTNHLGGYKFRIIAPIYLNYVMVSYQGRDITGKAKERYKACSIKDELYHHKHLVYGVDNATTNVVVILEGITDVWKMGYGSVGTFGVEFTQEQVNMLAQKYQRYFILYDKDDAGQEQAEKLSAALYVARRNADIEIITLDNVEDPAELTDEDANYIMKQLTA